MTLLRTLLILTVLAAFGQQAWGAILFGEYYRGVRAMGMGDAFSAVADDADSVFYNPAGLALVRKFEFVLLNPKIDVSKDDVTSISSLKGASSTLDGPALSKFFGQHIYLDGSVLPMILFPGFALGYYDDYQASLVARNLALPSMNFTYLHDRGLVGGLAHEFKMGAHQYLRFGFSGKLLTRNGFDQTISLEEMLLLDKSYFKGLTGNSANGFGATAGFQYQIDLTRASDIIFSGVWQDIGDTSFGSIDQSDRPPSIPQNAAVGFAFVQRFNQNPRADSNLKFTAEMRHLELTGADPRLKIHVGAELALGLASVQVGVNGDSLCAGAGVDLGFFNLSAVTYGVEDESGAFMDRERRYMLQMTLRFDIMGKTVRPARDEERAKHPRVF